MPVSPPVSAVPVSAYPTSGYGYPAPVPAQPKKSKAALVLGIATGLLVLATGVMTTLFVLKSGELADTKTTLTQQVADRDKTIASKDRELSSGKSQLETTKGELEKSKQSLEGVTNENKAMVACLDKLDAFMKKSYHARGKPENWRMIREDHAHFETHTMRAAALAWLDRHLLNGGAKVE